MVLLKYDEEIKGLGKQLYNDTCISDDKIRIIPMQNRASIMHNLLLIGHLSTYIQVAVNALWPRTGEYVYM